MATIFEDPELLGGPLSVRERFRRVMHYQKVDRIPFFEFGYWDETLGRWHAEGLPPEVDNAAKAYAYFGIEDWGGVPANVQLTGKPYAPQTLEETDDYIITRDAVGTVAQQNKGRDRTIPHFLEYGLKSRDDWPRFRAHLQPTLEGRIDPRFYQSVARYRARQVPIAAPIGSMIGVPRNWMGFERCATLAYDDPGLLDEIVEALCQCVVVVLEELCQYVDFDFGAGWEDICFNSGPIVSPWIFDRYIVPRYRRITDVLRRHGCDIAWTDCDGNVCPILGQFLEGGINCMFPVEVNAGSDPVRIREACGDAMRMVGGVDKMALGKGPQAIEAELERLLPLVEHGGFIPTVDHRVPASVPLEHYRFYIKTKRQLFRAGYREPQYAE
ncbi:MAG: uroporphyrinogen decarboxylase family protein [Candidatus Brocadiia bacterium]